MTDDMPPGSGLERAREDDLDVLHHAITELSFLRHLAMVTSSELDEDALCRLIIAETCEQMDVQVCSLYAVEDGELVLRATNGLNPAGIGVARMPIGSGITGDAALRVQTVAVPDVADDARFNWIDGVDQERFTAMCSTPVVSGGHRVVGVLNVQREDRHLWSPDEIAMLEAIASQLAGVIERSQLQQQLERRLRAEQAATRRWRRLSQSRHDLLSIVSHDVRTPLSIALTYLDALRDRLAGQDREVAEEVIGELGSVTRMVETILSSLAVEAGSIPLTRRDLDLRRFLVDAAAALQPTVTTHRLVTDALDPPVIVHVDADRLRQVVHNLVINAVRHSPEGTLVHIGVQVDDGGAVIVVDDEGAGVAEQERDEVFERFRRGGERRGPGTGLGLFIVKTIVEAHGGTAGVEEAPRGGARFWVRLPRVTTGGDAS
jgi:signal transduction histidine kinase